LGMAIWHVSGYPGGLTILPIRQATPLRQSNRLYQILR
jgi:hypothetical protein